MNPKGIMAILAAAGVAMCAQGADIEIDFGTATGPVKPVHAAGQGKDGLWVVAAKGEKGAAAFAVNDSPHERTVTFDLGGRKPVSCRVVDGDRTDEELDIPYDIPSECTLTPHSIMLVTFE